MRNKSFLDSYDESAKWRLQRYVVIMDWSVVWIFVLVAVLVTAASHVSPHDDEAKGHVSPCS